jgi:spore cortex formation protein SpoVR/YcgB (stage V sporulation)
MYLAEFYFDAGKYSEVIQLLEAYFELNAFPNIKVFDILHRTIFVLSLLYTGQIGKAIPQIKILSKKVILYNLWGMEEMLQSMNSICKTRLEYAQ